MKELSWKVVQLKSSPVSRWEQHSHVWNGKLFPILYPSNIPISSHFTQSALSRESSTRCAQPLCTVYFVWGLGSFKKTLNFPSSGHSVYCTFFRQINLCLAFFGKIRSCTCTLYSIVWRTLKYPMLFIDSMDHSHMSARMHTKHNVSHSPAAVGQQ